MKFPQRPPWRVAVLCVGLTILLVLAFVGLRQLFQPGDRQVAAIPEPPAITSEESGHRPKPDAKIGKMEEKRTENRQKRSGIAIILDDAGYNLNAVRRVLALPYPVAVSILPSAPFARDTAELVRQADHIVMLHLPMEPAGQHYRDIMGDDFLRADMGRQDIERLVQSELAAVPYVEGVNNHMGSMLTTMRQPMQWVMRVLHSHSLFFIDSRTDRDSVAADEARLAKVPWGSRRIFLDHDPAPAAIDAAWKAALRCYHRRGACIVIGHPNMATLAFLERGVSKQEQLAIVPITRLLSYKSR